MTTRPTNEEIRAMAEQAERGDAYVLNSAWIGPWMSAWLTERQEKDEIIRDGKQQWDEVAALLGVHGDDADAVLAAAKKVATECQAARDGVTDEMLDVATTAYDQAMRDAGYNDEMDDGLSYASPMAMRAALQSVEKPVSVPKKANYPKPDPNTGEDKGPCCAHAYADGWNACREAMLSAAPEDKP